MTVLFKYMAASAPLKLQYTLNKNNCQIHCIYTIHGCKCSSKINTVSIEEWMTTTTFMRKRNSWKKQFPTIKHSKLKEKMFFRNNYFRSKSFFMNFHCTKIFVHLLIVAVVSNFKVFKLIGWDPANTYLFKVNNRNSKKKCEICSKLTIKMVEQHSGVFIVNVEHISHLFLV